MGYNSMVPKSLRVTKKNIRKKSIKIVPVSEIVLIFLSQTNKPVRPAKTNQLHMQKRSSVTLDCTIFEFDKFVTYLMGLDITFKINTWSGPSGWPVITFYGTQQNIVRLKIDYWNGKI